MRTPLCDALGIEHPIVSAPMGPDLAGPELVAAVSGAGGLGILQAQFAPPEALREQIREIRSRTAKPFGVSAILHFPCDPLVEVCLEERVPVLWTFWGDPAKYVAPAHAAGVKVFHQCGSVAEARSAARAGVDVVVAQGSEAGGHVRGDVSTLVLVPRVVDAIAPTPVIASGGIADGRGLVAVLALGAQAGVLGTRFLASRRVARPPALQGAAGPGDRAGHRAHDALRCRLAARAAPRAAHAVRREVARRRGARAGRPARRPRRRPDGGGRTRPRGARVRLLPAQPRRQGDVESMGMLAGQCVGAIDSIKPAAEIVREIAAEAQRLERRLNETRL